MMRAIKLITMTILMVIMTMGCASHLRQETYIFQHPDTSVRIQEHILAGTIMVGMTKDEVQASKGLPWELTRTADEFGVNETWTFCKYPAGASFNSQPLRIYVYFGAGEDVIWVTVGAGATRPNFNWGLE